MLNIQPDTIIALASEKELGEFERANNLTFSPEHRHFLTTEVNGGFLLQEIAIPTLDCPGGAALLQGIYGVNHPNQSFDLFTACAATQMLLPRFVPFGYDEVGGRVFIDMADRPGRLVYIPTEELDNEPLVTYHVAESIAKLFEEGALLAMQLEAEYNGA